MKLSLAVLGTVTLACVSSVSAFQVAMPHASLRGGNALTSLKCTAGDPLPGVAPGRRDALFKIAAAATGLPAMLSLPARAGAAKKDDDDDEPANPGAQQREVTYKADDEVCSKHPTWKQCRKKAGGAGTNAEKTKLDNGLVISEISLGKGITPQLGDTVTVHYSLFYNGDEIESSRESSGLAAAPLGFQFGNTEQILPALNLGIDGMKVGGIRRIIAPPEMAFGKKGKKPRIPPDATVEFDVQLLTVKRAGTNPISSQGRGSEKNTGLFDLF